MALPAIVKVGSLAYFLWLLFHEEPKKVPAPAPAPKPEPQVPPSSEAPPDDIAVRPAPTTVPVPCAGPVLAKRWTLCDGGGVHAVGATTSQGDYDALYHGVTKRLICVVDNTTYDADGNSAWVAALVPYISKTTQKATDAGDPNGLPLGLNVAPTRQGEVPFFPLVYKGL